MLTPPMPNVAGMTDTLDFVKNLWGSMNVPGTGMAGPSLSTDELDKKIADLKAVENWLNLNANMLRATIQAMEVQRGTIATLKSMSESMAQAMGQGGAEAKPGAPAAPFQFFAQPGSAPGAGQPQAGAAGAGQPPAGAPGGAPAQEAGPAAAALPAAMAWWNLLQDQFKQAVASTMSPEAVAQATAMAQDAAARFGAPSDGGKPAAPEGKQEAAEPGGNNKAKGARPKADKA